MRRARRLRATSRDVPLSQAKVVLLINFIPPYRLALFEDLAERVGELLVWVSTPMEVNRAWQPDWGRLNVVVQRAITLEQSKRHPHGFTERQIVHVPYDTIPRLHRARPDVVFTAEFGLRTAQAGVWCAATGTPLAVFAGFSEWSEKGRDHDRVRRGLRRALLARADVVFVPGQSGARYVRAMHARPERIVIAPFYSTIAAPPAPSAPSGDGELRLLYVGQLIERKGIVSFAQALGRWGRRHPDRRVALRLVGDGPQAADLAGLSLPGNVRVKLVGSLPYARMVEAYAEADVFVFPTLADVWGLVVNEAMTAGLPVLGSAYSQAVEELVEDGVNGWRFEPDRPATLDAALERVLEVDSVELRRMGARAREAVRFLTPAFVTDRIADGLGMALIRH
jgi:glycosyltransferase involved in cell wall biosynthesis